MKLIEKRFVDALKAVPNTLDPDKRTLSATISSNSVDRDGEIIEPSAFTERIATFLKNPLLLWMHNAFEPPIGKVTSLEFTKNSIEADLKFRAPGKSERADEVFGLFEDGTLNSFSIGFRVFEMVEGKTDEGEFKPPRITQAELLEVSAVTIPANTDAVAKMVRKADLFREANQYLPDSLKIGFKNIDPEIEPYSSITPLRALELTPKLITDILKKRAAGEDVSDQEIEAVIGIRVALLGVDKLLLPEDVGALADDFEKHMQSIRDSFVTKPK